MTCEDEIRELQRIKSSIKSLLAEAKDIVNNLPSTERTRSLAYWFPQISVALDNDHDYIGSCPFTMQEVIDEMAEELEIENLFED